MNELAKLDVMNRMPPSFTAALNTYSVNVPNIVNVRWQPLYSRKVYAAAGQTELKFFSDTSGNSGITEEDTNMETTNQLGSPQYFLAVGVRFDFKPLLPIGNTYNADPADASDFVNDVQAVNQSGVIKFRVGNKDQLQDSPLGRFPPTNRLDVQSALSDSTTAGALQLASISYAQNMGMPYQITPTLIPPTQTFNMKCLWETPIVLPSGQPGSITCYLDGWLFESAQ